jgi:CheY-like chemotaxis protein
MMQHHHPDVTILIAEDDDGHASLIKRNLRRTGLDYPIIRFRDGQEIHDFLFGGEAEALEKTSSFFLLLDIRMPKISGIEILRKIKNTPHLKNMPVVILTTTDDPKEVSRCHELGCNCYIRKPIDYDSFVKAIRQLGLLMMVLEVPEIRQTKNAVH